MGGRERSSLVPILVRMARAASSRRPIPWQLRPWEAPEPHSGSLSLAGRPLQPVEAHEKPAGVSRRAELGLRAVAWGSGRERADVCSARAIGPVDHPPALRRIPEREYGSFCEGGARLQGKAALGHGRPSSLGLLERLP